MPTCITCQSNLRRIFSLGSQPLANKYPKDGKEMESEFHAEMVIYFCDECGYANAPCDVNRDVFFEDYYYLSSVNKELSNHFGEFAQTIEESGFRFVVDIGSNDGVLLSPLKSRGVQCLGVDPSENVSKIANDNGLMTIVGFFDSNVVGKILAEHGRPDLITASSVFTHLENPSEFFLNVKNLLEPNGSLIIEVEYLGKIIEDYAFERFYFDRPHYYSLRSLVKIGASHGFRVEDASIVDVHGGSLRVTFSLKDSTTINPLVTRMLEDESITLSWEGILAKFSMFQAACLELRASLTEFAERGILVAGYGCPARFSTITNYAQISTSNLCHVIDDSPLKQGRFSPGQHIPILSFDSSKKPDLYVVFAYEYINSIKRKVGPLNRGYYKPVPFIEI